LKNLLRDSQRGETKDDPARHLEDPTKPTVVAATSAAPPVPTEAQMERRDVGEVKAEGTKDDEDGDGDAMVVEQAPVQPPFEETMINEHAKERPTSTDRRDREDDSHVR